MHRPLEFKVRLEWQDDKGCTVKGAMATMLLISRVCGLAPVNMIKKRSGYYITLSPTLCYMSGCFSVLLCVAMVRDLITTKDQSVRLSTSMTAAVFITEMLLINLAMTLGVFGAPSRIRHMIKIKNTINKVELHLETERKFLSEKRTSAGVIIFLGTTFIFLAFDYFLNIQRAYVYNKDRIVAYLYISFFIQYAITFVLQFQFVIIALAVQKSIKRMNDSFEDISLTLYIQASHENKIRSMNEVRGREAVLYQSLESVNCLIDSLTNSKMKKHLPFVETMNPSVSSHEAVGRLSALHCLLCDMVNETNSIYGMILITFLLILLLHLIMSPYYLILQLEDTHRRFYKLILQFFWCLFHTANMFLVVEPCHRTTQEFTRTQELVSRLMRRLGTNSCQLAMQLDLFSRQLLLRQVYYAPMGMCIMNRPLITSIIGGVTTYLVILIQFQKFTEINGTGTV